MNKLPKIARGVWAIAKGIAEKIAKITNADLYEIKPAQPYTDADLDWNDSSSRSTAEQNNKSARPEIASEKLSLDGYSTIYVGYPIWWGEVLGYGCGTPSMTKSSPYPGEAYKLGKNLK